jgi:hypothetical protein
MAHFAKLGIGNIVTTVHVVSNDIATTEQAGIDFLNKLHKTNDVWKQTSYNTIGGKHNLGGTPLRKNYAGIGFHYNEELDAFIPPKPFKNWSLNTNKWCWEAPVAKPVTHTQNVIDESGKSSPDIYYWNEQKVRWEL